MQSRLLREGDIVSEFELQDPDQPSAKPKEVEQWQLGKCHGVRQHSRVFEVTKQSTKFVYIAKITPQSVKPDVRSAVLNEVANLKLAQEVPCVMKFIHFFETPDNMLVIVEFCPYNTLQHCLNTRRYFTDLEVQCIGKQLISCLKDLRKLKIMHRDIRVCNLYFSRQMDIRLGNFGNSLQYTGEQKTYYDVIGDQFH